MDWIKEADKANAGKEQKPLIKLGRPSWDCLNPPKRGKRQKMKPGQYNIIGQQDIDQLLK